MLHATGIGSVDNSGYWIEQVSILLCRATPTDELITN